MNYFIDCGANDGCSVEMFRNVFDRNCKYKVISFEGNPSFKDSFKEYKNHELINKCVWVNDGKIRLYIDRQKNKSGSSVIKEKKTYIDKNYYIDVECIDLSKWIIKNMTKDDYVILKLDIEGAEYKILEKMIKDNTFDLIDVLYIEWHGTKIGMTKDEHNIHFNRIKKLGIEMLHWDALRKKFLR